MFAPSQLVTLTICKDIQPRRDTGGVFSFINPMSELNDLLRCPLDPARTTHLHRDGQTLHCRSCRVTFPVKLGIPILVLREAELPDDVPSVDKLPCVRRSRK
jgi:uncharacterized protein YbaR (Trm112 family)